jgi:prepilin-type N-terminal cleavage/methylation domain-containing protein
MSMTRVFRSRFTLIELLIVITIIAILVAMLLPALSRARDKAHIVLCIANCKQVGTALSSYADDSSGNYPHRTTFYTIDVAVEVPPGSGTFRCDIRDALLEYGGSSDIYYCSITSRTDPNDAVYPPGTPMINERINPDSQSFWLHEPAGNLWQSSIGILAGLDPQALGTDFYEVSGGATGPVFEPILTNRSVDADTVIATEWCESYTVESNGDAFNPGYGMHHDGPLDCRGSARVHADGSAKWLKRTDPAYEAQWTRGPGQIYWFW